RLKPAPVSRARCGTALARKIDRRTEVRHRLARVEAARIVGPCPAEHHDLGGSLVSLDGPHIDRVGPERIAEPRVPVAPAERPVISPVRAPIRVWARTEWPRDLSIHVAFGVALDDGEPVVARLHRQLGGATEKIVLDAVARSELIADEGDAVAV